MNIAESTRVSAPKAAQSWLTKFSTALEAQDAHAAADLFLADGLWRDVLAFTWTIETMSGQPAIETVLGQTLARAKPVKFHIPPKRTPPRRVSRAGTQSIEVIFEFETALGPCNGVVRLVPDPQTPSRLRAWTLLTT
ncbi:MAG TPA: monooxygenase, partial [Pseudolabrys sp.]